MPPLDESWQGGAEPIDTHPRCSFEAEAIAAVDGPRYRVGRGAALLSCMEGGTLRADCAVMPPWANRRIV